METAIELIGAEKDQRFLDVTKLSEKRVNSSARLKEQVRMRVHRGNATKYKTIPRTKSTKCFHFLVLLVLAMEMW